MVYLLYHRRPMGYMLYNDKMIGVYSSYEKAESVIARYAVLPGFRDFATEFHIVPYHVTPYKKTHRKKRVKAVCVLFTEMVLKDEEEEITESYDVYSGRWGAIMGLIGKWLVQSRSVKRKFSITEYFLDEDNWREGFADLP